MFSKKFFGLPSQFWFGFCMTIIVGFWGCTSSVEKKTMENIPPASASPAFNENFLGNEDYKGYLEFFQEVYKTFSENYYHPVSTDKLKKFLYVFNTRIYPKFKLGGASDRFIKWRSSAYLVEASRSPDDILSAFYPPVEA